MRISVGAAYRIDISLVTHRQFAFVQRSIVCNVTKWCAFFSSAVTPAIAGHSYVGMCVSFIFSVFAGLSCTSAWFDLFRSLWFAYNAMEKWVFRLFVEVLSTLKFVRPFVNMYKYIPRTDREFQITEANKSCEVMMLCTWGIRFIYVGSVNRRGSSPILGLDSCVHSQWHESRHYLHGKWWNQSQRYWRHACIIMINKIESTRCGTMKTCRYWSLLFTGWLNCQNNKIAFWFSFGWEI